MKFIEVEDAPGGPVLEPDTVYVIGSPVWYIHFLCPCGCGSTVHLPINVGPHPRWDYEPSTHTVTPSILGTRGCKSHFYIRNGEVVWV